MRNVSIDNTFHPENSPPPQHLASENILDKPGKLDMRKIEKNTKPLAGRLTEIGHQILKLGSQKAKFVCTGHWDEMFKKDKTKSNNSTARPDLFPKITEYDAFEASRSNTKPKKVVKTSKHSVQLSPIDFKSEVRASKGLYEVSRSPKRDQLIQDLKQRRANRREMRNTARINLTNTERQLKDLTVAL